MKLILVLLPIIYAIEQSYHESCGSFLEDTIKDLKLDIELKLDNSGYFIVNKNEYKNNEVIFRFSNAHFLINGDYSYRNYFISTIKRQLSFSKEMHFLTDVFDASLYLRSLVIFLNKNDEKISEISNDLVVKLNLVNIAQDFSIFKIKFSRCIYENIKNSYRIFWKKKESELMVNLGFKEINEINAFTKVYNNLLDFISNEPSNDKKKYFQILLKDKFVFYHYFKYVSAHGFQQETQFLFFPIIDILRYTPLSYLNKNWTIERVKNVNDMLNKRQVKVKLSVYQDDSLNYNFKYNVDLAKGMILGKSQSKLISREEIFIKEAIIPDKNWNDFIRINLSDENDFESNSFIFSNYKKNKELSYLFYDFMIKAFKKSSDKLALTIANEFELMIKNKVNLCELLKVKLSLWYKISSFFKNVILMNRFDFDEEYQTVNLINLEIKLVKYLNLLSYEFKKIASNSKTLMNEDQIYNINQILELFHSRLILEKRFRTKIVEEDFQSKIDQLKTLKKKFIN